MKRSFLRVAALIALGAFCATMGVRAIDTQHALGADPDINAAIHGDGQLPLELLAQELSWPESGSFDEHCALCHWARTFSNSLAAEPVRDGAPDASATFIARHSDSIRSVEPTAGPPRGPPSLA